MISKLRQRGALLMAAVVLVVIIVAMVTAMSFLSVSNLTGSGSHMSSAQAFYIANSGLERALYQLGQNGIACGSLTDNKTVGAGSYAATGTVYPLAATSATLSSAITAASTTIPFTVSVGAYTNYSPHGRILIENEEIDYRSVSNSAGVCGTAPCFVAEARGTNGTTAAAHGNGVALFQPTQCLIQSTGTAGAATRVMQAVVRKSGVQAYAFPSTNPPQYLPYVNMTAEPRTVKISPVSPSKSFVVCQTNSGATNGSQPNMLATCELTAPDTVTVTTGATDIDAPINFYVAEFMSGVTVQRGLAPFNVNGTGGGPTAGDPVISAVNLANSFILTNTRLLASGTAVNGDENWLIRAAFTDSTHVHLDRNQQIGGPALMRPTVAWQVVQMSNASVQYLLPSIANGSLTGTAAISPVVNTASSFVVFSTKGTSGVMGVENIYQTSCALCPGATCGNSNTLTCTRGQTASAVTIGAFVVAMSDAASVQSGTAEITGSNSGTANNVITNNFTAVDTSRSLPFLSFNIASRLANNPASAQPSSNAYLDDVYLRSCWGNHLGGSGLAVDCQTPSNNEIHVARYQNSQVPDVMVSWFVVQFASQISIVDRGEYFP